MSPRDLAIFKRVIQSLGYSNKTHLTRSEVDKFIEELNLSREYSLMVYFRYKDPAAISALLR